ncbi:Tetratricopeptide repeat-containing protein [Nitrosomonas aestuarii]|uniref:Tetratricopeptide repeat-containing protein n=1 Tax=Nitrosomonas aestuarii TaxID=52441 RepID=A0A1I3Y5E3_9PROT|nr:tetratricopeptide repeat protein [Nitrosomonas aestuarii]SFK26629.1 Tetratricopeptide repeat-containing protein [Nitrosomonas aestuarii]
MKPKILALLLTFGLTACVQFPIQEGGDKSEKSIESSKTAESREVVDKGDDEEIDTSRLPKQALTAPILFDFLLGETALQRGNLDIAVSRYLKLAETTRDPRIAKRASEVALHARHPFAAERAASLWVELDPDSLDARQTLAAMLVNLGKLDAAFPHLEKLLASDEENVGNAFMQLNQLLSRNSSKAETLRLIQKLAVPYPKFPEVHFAISQAAWFSGDYDTALAEMEQALTLRPGWDVAAVQNGRMLQRRSNSDAMHFYRDYLTKYPETNEVRIVYTRLLVELNEKDSAREQLQILFDNNQEDAEIMVAIGLISTELYDFDMTERSLKKALALGYQDASAIHFHLARVYEEMQQTDLAMESYRQVQRGGRYLPAQIRYADLLAQKGQLGDARLHIQQLPAVDDQQTAHLILAEAQILRRAGSHQEVFRILDKGLEKLPDYPELLYDRALAADKIGKFEILETDLLKLIELKPDNAHAYNALGYSYAERGKRLPEALRLIKKAVELSPDDPYIMDSLGWVYYRMGNITDGLNYLSRAFSISQDSEIAAHLGEVLWVQGAHKDAEDVWRSALEKDPNNEILLETIKRLKQ